MSVTIERVLTGYSDLAQTERFLGTTSAALAENRADALPLIAQEVRERIDRELGTSWSDEEPVATVRVAWGQGFALLALPIPAIDVLSVEPFRAFDLGNREQATGYIRNLRIDPSGSGSDVVLDWGGTPYQIEAVWADRPGGNPPEAIVGFASAVTAELWRRRNAPAAAYLNPDGVAVGAPDPWASQGWADLKRIWAVRPLTRAVS